jgi:hypothetical protein
METDKSTKGNPTIYSKPDTLPELQVDINLSTDLIKILIGRNGYFLKNITHDNNLEYLWFDVDTSKMNFWGSSENCLNANTMISNRIDNIKKYYLPDKKLKITLDNENLKKFIGLNGFYLKQIENKTNCKIWFNKLTDEFYFWGDKNKIVHAETELLKRKESKF